MEEGGRNGRVSGIWSRKLYDPKIWKNGTIIISAVEQNGSRMKGFRKPRLSYGNEALLKRFKQVRNDDVPGSG